VGISKVCAKLVAITSATGISVIKLQVFIDTRTSQFSTQLERFLCNLLEMLRKLSQHNFKLHAQGEEKIRVLSLPPYTLIKFK
jgi:hypothetical protein